MASETIVVEFVGGPFDGQVRQIPERVPVIEVPQFSQSRDGPAFLTGRYVAAAHTRFGDPYRYEWRAPTPQEERAEGGGEHG